MRPLKYTRRHAASHHPPSHTPPQLPPLKSWRRKKTVCATLRDPTKRFVHIVQNLPRTFSHLIVHDKLHVANCAQNNLFFHLRASVFGRPVLQSCFSRITTFALCPASCVWTARHCVSYRFYPITDVQFAQSRPWELRLSPLPTVAKYLCVILINYYLRKYHCFPFFS